MSYPGRITLHAEQPDEPQVGDAWYDPEDFWRPESFAPEHAGKRPLRVQVSDTHSFMIFSRSSRPPHSGWQVSGSVEDGTLTVRPSIFINAGRPDEFHGFITSGQVTSC